MINIDQSNLTTHIPNLVDITYITKVTGFTKAHIYNEINAGRLAKPIKFNRRSRWKAEDVANWINSYIEQGAN
ncbi:helix-turn-helix transcriptional regulator [Orbus mooreae]|uniref:helix-turn-helix transcriptional regulator n=1 Tax=Orbus mooreae TaxID=3074107 RepID=UPI00370D7FEE